MLRSLNTFRLVSSMRSAAVVGARSFSDNPQYQLTSIQHPAQDVVVICPLVLRLVRSGGLTMLSLFRRSVNKATLIGSVGKDIEVIYQDEEKALARFPLATSFSHMRDGERVSYTEWHNIVVKGSNAVSGLQGKIKKGAFVHVEGRIESRAYEHDGQERKATQIVCSGPKYGVQLLWAPEGSTDGDVDDEVVDE